jgi:hypothetical protein
VTPVPALDIDTMRCAARLAGFAWSDDELEAIRPGVETMLRELAGLEALDLGGDLEPTTHYRAI